MGNAEYMGQSSRERLRRGHANRLSWRIFEKMKLSIIAASLLSVQSRNTQRDQHSKTLLYLNDLEREFRSRTQHLNTKDEVNEQMSNIVQMFHDHRTNSCYNHRAHTQVKGSLESADGLMDYATILNKMIDHAFGDCEQYIGQLRIIINWLLKIFSKIMNFYSKNYYFWRNNTHLF